MHTGLTRHRDGSFTFALSYSRFAAFVAGCTYLFATVLAYGVLCYHYVIGQDLLSNVETVRLADPDVWFPLLVAVFPLYFVYQSLRYFKIAKDGSDFTFSKLTGSVSKNAQRQVGCSRIRAVELHTIAESDSPDTLQLRLMLGDDESIPLIESKSGDQVVAAADEIAAFLKVPIHRDTVNT